MGERGLHDATDTPDYDLVAVADEERTIDAVAGLEKSVAGAEPDGVADTVARAGPVRLDEGV